MPANKDFKRLVRTRMRKTGESYTAARVHLLAQKRPTRRSAPAAWIDAGTIGGITDAVLKEKTGCTWERWVRALDHKKAHEWPRQKINTYIHEKYKVETRLASRIAAGYRRIKGLRTQS